MSCSEAVWLLVGLFGGLAYSGSENYIPKHACLTSAFLPISLESWITTTDKAVPVDVSAYTCSIRMAVAETTSTHIWQRQLDKYH